MFDPFIIAFGWIRAHVPVSLKAIKPRLNFLTLHYTYLICMTILTSIILFPGNNMAYIDALFFSSGAATQSGLNTIDVNKLKLYQQVTLMLVACVCNPIFINSFVVFVRLYWFEKRFQNVVLEARTLRRNKTRSRTKSEAREDVGRDVGHEENGVGDREIVVLRASNGHAEGKLIEDQQQFKEADDESRSESSGSGRGGATEPVPETGSPIPSPSPKQDTSFHRDIMFADEVPQDNTSAERMPAKKSKEQNIAFVENQRNPADKGTLRIPGPRDFDMGYVPQRIEEDDEDLDKQTTNVSEEHAANLRRKRSNSVPPTEGNDDDHQIKSHITFDPADARPRPHTGPSAYNRDMRTKTSDSETVTPGMHLRSRARTKTFSSFLSREKEEEHDPMPYLSWTPTVGRNSAFVDLTEEQREELGGIEYRSLKMLAIILVCYYVGFHVFGMIFLLPWITRSAGYSALLRSENIVPSWWGVFTPASMFNDLGYTLTPDSMISFQTAVLPLVIGTFLIIIGNTGFPCMLRFIIWLVSRAVPYGSGIWEELRFLLDHPRRCFTLLFPSSANWWLFGVLILLNGIDLLFFIILDLNDETVTQLSGGFRFLDGLFQAAATRTAGFGVVNIANLHPAIQVSYLIMMYISVFPIAISMRNTNVYEEKSLGVWSSEDNDDSEETTSYLGTHLRRQLSFDLWFVFLGFFLIAIIEGSRLENTNEYAFTLFSVLFEIVSAYGTVGLSLGYPNTNASFSAQFKTLSKLIIIAMQIRGRHRGLPYALDRAILLPSESLHKKEDEDAGRRARRGSTASEIPGMGGPGGIVRTGTGTGLSRRGSNATMSRSAFPGPQQVGRFLSGALSAGPSISREREKRA